MCALIAQHGSVLVALATLQRQPDVHHNDEQIDFLKILFHIILMFQQNSIKTR
jgi:hypothetical protein